MKLAVSSVSQQEAGKRLVGMVCTQAALAEEVRCCVLTRRTRLIKPCVHGRRRILIQSDRHLSLHAASEQRSQTSCIENAGADILAGTQIRFSDGSLPPLRVQGTTEAGHGGGVVDLLVMVQRRPRSSLSLFVVVRCRKERSCRFLCLSALSSSLQMLVCAEGSSSLSFCELSHLQVTFYAQ